MGVAATVAPKGLGPQDPTKKVAHWVDLLGQLLTLKLVFQDFGPEPPLREQRGPRSIFTFFDRGECQLSETFFGMKKYCSYCCACKLQSRFPKNQL